MKKKEDIHIGQRVKTIRANLELDQRAFANKIGATVSALSNWENGRNKPNGIMLNKIAKLGNISVEELLFGEKQEILTFESGKEFDEYRELLLKKIISDDLKSRVTMFENDYIRALINKGEEKISNFLSENSIKKLESAISESINITPDNKNDYENLVQINIDSFYLSIALLNDESSEYLAKLSIISKEEQDIILNLLDSMIKKEL